MSTGARDRLARTGSRGAVRALAVLLVVAVVGVAVLAWRLASDGAGADQAEALQVARERAEQMTTYTADTFDADVSWATTGATERFADEYAQASEALRAVVGRLEASATGSVAESAARPGDDGAVEVLLFVDQTITQGSDGEQRTERSRVVMTMVQVDDAWLVDDVVLS